MFYNPLDKFYKSQTGAVCEDTLVTFRVTGNFKDCVLVLCKDFSEQEQRYVMTRQDGYFECSCQFEVGLYWYYFDLLDSTFIGKGDNYRGVITDSPKAFQLSVYHSDYEVPSWMNGGIIYQIFPDRFNKSGDFAVKESHKVYHENLNDTPIYKPNIHGQVLNNDFFGGNFNGITEKLDYLKDLNVTVIYLNPIFKAYSNHRYDTGDYGTFDPLLGTEQDFKKLITEAKKRGIKIILDGVFNHTGDDSLYFNKYGRYDTVGAFQDANSPYKSWFKFINYPNEYESWWGIMTLPAVNKTNSGYVDYIAGENGILQKYIKMGVAGWRLDVVDELPGSFVRKIRSAVKGASKNAIVIGEVWEDASNKISYGNRRQYFLGKELDSVMNYPLKNAILCYVKTGNQDAISYTVKEQLDHYPTKVVHALMNLLSTHDTFRLLSELGEIDGNSMSKDKMAVTSLADDLLSRAKIKMKLATLLQFTLCGVPSIYYGEEAGMQGYRDPLNRKFYPWDNQDKEILDWYKFLGSLRGRYSCFKTGNYTEICSRDGVFGFKRSDDVSEIAIFTNVSNAPETLVFEGTLKDLYTGNQFTNRIKIMPMSFLILTKELEA